MKTNLFFTQATSTQTDQLRALARDSEAHWGYSSDFMARFDLTFNITPSFILENPVYAAWDGHAPLAFWGLKQDENDWELEYFYVAEHTLGKGYGQQMWRHMTDWCRSHAVASFHFVTSPQAIGFYEKMGAVQDGATHSSLDGRPIPHFICKL